MFRLSPERRMKSSEDRCVYDLFEEQVERTPAEVAVVYEGDRLTYAELNRRANQVAHYLRSLGVGPEVRVGLCMERSVEMLVGLIGILKAGGAYVPLDPSYPSERLKYMAEDAQVAALIIEGSAAGVLDGYDGRVIDLKAERGTIALQSEENPVPVGSSANLAYVIYTSGSTGKPKGVAVTHNNVARLFAATQPWFNFSQNDVWTMFHSYAFDFSVWELWGALLFGGKLVLVSQLQSRSPEEFYELLHAHQVTVLNQTPSAFRQLIEVEQKNRRRLSLRAVIFGGEALNPTMLDSWLARYPNTMLVNMYGITEITVHGTYRELGQKDAQASQSVIGVGIPDLHMYVLDESMKPAPAGAAGELYVGGAGLARGYLNRPELTADRFVPDPFGRQSGGRLYKTGDCVRLQADGELEFLGRVDDQVKIRGYRIEPGEIEAALREHSAVRDVVVIAREDESGQKRLVAYLVDPERKAPELAELREHLERQLPDYMVPAAYVVLDSLPLTTNGKLNRDALPVPDSTRPELIADYVAPRTRVEEMLCEIWAHVLGLDEMGVEDDFFEFGGHSLLATQVVSQVRRVFGIEVELRRLFEATTVAAFAKVVEEIYAQQGGIGGALLDDVEDLSSDEVEELLSKDPNSISL